MTVIIFLIVLAVLIFVHELGHFLSARLFGIRVDAFKIGFGPKLLAWKRGGTDFGLNLIPFGGYVKIFGENPDEESISGPDSNRSFINKARWKQAIVLASGVLFNFIFAWLLYIAVFTTGVTATTTGFERYADRFENERIMVTFVSPDSPAEKAGMKSGDVIASVNGEVSPKIERVQEVINKSGGKPVNISLMRGKEQVSVQANAVSGLVDDRMAIGISMDNVGDLRLPFFLSVWEGFGYTGIMIKETAVGLYTFISNIFQGEANFSDVAGPVGIAGIVGGAAELGFTYLIMITALISINLGVINLMPFPALDGGRLLFVLIESIIRRRIPIKFANVVNAVGFILLMILMVVVTYQDIAKLVK